MFSKNSRNVGSRNSVRNERVPFGASQFVRDSVTSTTEALMFAFPVYWIGGMSPNLDQFRKQFAD